MKFSVRLASLAMAVAMAFSFGGCAQKGEQIINAYDIAVKNGFEGTEAEWLESLKGRDGDNAQTVYKSLYEEAKERGFDGTFDDFLREYLAGYTGGDVGRNNDISAAADKAMFSVVSVYSVFAKTVRYYDGRGKLQSRVDKIQGAGSGVIVSLDEKAGNAYILTNFHVIYDYEYDDDGYADQIEVYVYGRGRETEVNGYGVKATIVGATATYDLAVLKVEDSEIFRTSNLKEAEFGDKYSIAAGERIIAVGNPEGVGISVTSGIISVDSEYIKMDSPKDGRSVEYRVMRIDAAVNGGNSGGGLFDISGKLIGIVNAKMISDEIDNIAYAIPVTIVENVYNNIIKNCDGKDTQVLKCTLGLTLGIKNSYGYYDETLKRSRIVHDVCVTAVTSGGSADGLMKVGDVITKMEFGTQSVKVERTFDVIDACLLVKEGDRITFTVERGGSVIEVAVTAPTANRID